MNPKDYFVAVIDMDGLTAVVVCPKEYYLEHGCLDDSFHEYQGFQEAGYYELMDSIYESPYEDHEDTMNSMIDFGFCQDSDFQSFCNSFDEEE